MTDGRENERERDMRTCEQHTNYRNPSRLCLGDDEI